MWTLLGAVLKKALGFLKIAGLFLPTLLVAAAVAFAVWYCGQAFGLFGDTMGGNGVWDSLCSSVASYFDTARTYVQSIHVDSGIPFVDNFFTLCGINFAVSCLVAYTSVLLLFIGSFVIGLFVMFAGLVIRCIWRKYAVALSDRVAKASASATSQIGL